MVMSPPIPPPSNANNRLSRPGASLSATLLATSSCMLTRVDRDNVITFAGRRVDAPGAPPRFPVGQIDVVRRRIEALFRTLGAKALVSSAACGADLLAIEVAASLGMRRRIVLPFAPERFRDTSVTDRSGDWGPRFDTALAAAKQSGDVVVLDVPENDDGYLRVNEALLDEAQMLLPAGGRVTAVLVWEGRPREGTDITASFAASARARGIPVDDILTG